MTWVLFFFYVYGEFYEIHTYTKKMKKIYISLENYEMREVIIFFKKEIIRQSPASAQAPCKIYCQNIHFSNWDCLLGLEAEQSDACWWRRANLMDASVIWNCQHLSSSALQAYGDDASVDSSQTDGSSQLVAHHSGLPHYSEHPLECMFPPPAWGKTTSGCPKAVLSSVAAAQHRPSIQIWQFCCT